MKRIFIFALIAAFFTISSNTAYGYSTTAQSAIPLTEHAALFTITYKFGHQDHDVYLPIVATRDLAHGSMTKELGYEILEDSRDTTDAGTAFGMVLSNAEIVDGMYKTKMGWGNTFTLVVLYTTPETLGENDYALRVTDLPFYFGEKREAQQLNKTELQHYTTPEVELNNED